MIGKVTWERNGQRYTATLEDDHTLNVTGPEGVEVLRLILQSKLDRYAADYSPARGEFGAEFLNELAAREGVKAEFEPREPAPEGTIF
jgi:hypothetical protein